MKSVIHKHSLSREFGEHTIHAPTDAVFLTVDSQVSDLVIWEKHNVPEQPKKAFTFAVVGTGEQHDDNGHVLIGTVLIGAMVYHVWQVWR